MQHDAAHAAFTEKFGWKAEDPTADREPFSSDLRISASDSKGEKGVLLLGGEGRC